MTSSSNTPSVSEPISPVEAAATTQPTFTMAQLASLYSSGLGSGYSNNKHQAVAHTLLRYNVHLDATYYETRISDGLHPSYISFNPIGTSGNRGLSRPALVDTSLGDLFDVIPSTLTPDKVNVDLYVTPCELHKQQVSFSGHIAAMVQVFCQEMVIPHLYHFSEHCNLEEVKPLVHEFSGSPISAIGPQHILPPLGAASSCIHCSALPEGNFSWTFKVIMPTQKPPQTPTSVRQCHPTKAFLLGRVKKELKSFTSSPLNLQVEQQTTVPFISISPHSDAILDRFGLDDTILGQLCDLISNVCTSHWEKTLITPEWGLKPNQASLLAAALLKDLQGPSVPAGKKFWVAFGIILKCLGALILLLMLLFILKVIWFVIMQ
ncbi:hypothetical protein J3R82DRAFT_2948 [Butyriboletus roseoflavus]|nr:hypothetical protein J3R82DRAFT_2948 [Butyriboletus roseoflavus]